MNLRHLDQKIDLEWGEARALQQALEHYLYQLAQRSASGSLSTAQALHIKPAGRLLTRLGQLLAGRWPRHGVKRFFQLRPPPVAAGVRRAAAAARPLPGR